MRTDAKRNREIIGVFGLYVESAGDETVGLLRARNELIFNVFKERHVRALFVGKFGVDFHIDGDFVNLVDFNLDGLFEIAVPCRFVFDFENVVAGLGIRALHSCKRYAR